MESTSLTSIILESSKKLVIAGLLSMLFACGGGGTNNTVEPITPPTLTIVEPYYWDIPTPDFSSRSDRPIITINGPRTILLPLNGEYEEFGAKASDPAGNDLSEDVVIAHQINTTIAGDYLVRYSMAESDNVLALDAVRVVRVGDVETVDYSRRPFGSTMSHLGYIEHLPKNYGQDPQKNFPVLIYNHGNGANASFAKNSPVEALDTLLANDGLPLIIGAGEWDNDLPFIVLMPQASFVEDSTPAERMNAFVDFAIQTYAADTTKIYMAGWSQGGLMSVDYAMNYPTRLAAVVTISGGDPFNDNLPENFCDIETMPLWAFHGDSDDVVDISRSIDLINHVTQQCQPTTLPKLTIFKSEQHFISRPIFDLSALIGGDFSAEQDLDYDAYDESIYQWLLLHNSNSNR